MRRRSIAILGSTGSIGVSTLKVVDRHPELFKVQALTAFNNAALLRRQIGRYRPVLSALGNREEDLVRIAGDPGVDIVVLAIRGAAALAPFLAAVRAGKTVAPANKEALVIAGDLIMAEAKRCGAVIVPVDSEQSAIFQCLEGRKDKVCRVHLTASGGPFRSLAAKQFGRVTVKDVLRHPRWKMGPKITVDSATLMNKGFEFIEAQRLFGLAADQIKVLVHPEAIIHSMVEFQDGSVLAQLGVTDMRLPIQYALTYPERRPSGLRPLDLAALRQLTFEAPDVRRFPALGLAIEAARKAGTAPCVLNAADEVAVDAFLEGRLGFTGIYKVVEKVLLRHKIIRRPSLGDITETDGWARAEARAIIGKL